MTKVLVVTPEVFTRKELHQYEQQILDNATATEHDASQFFAKFPKFLTIGGYKQIAKEVVLYKPSGEAVFRVDFCRCKFGNNYWDFVELKSPKVPFIVKRGQHWKFSSDIQGGIEQAQYYNDFLEESANRFELERRAQIKVFRPKLLLIGGRKSNIINEEDLMRLISRYNQIEIHSYDDIYCFAKDNYMSSCIAIPILQSSELYLPDENNAPDEPKATQEIPGIRNLIVNEIVKTGRTTVVGLATKIEVDIRPNDLLPILDSLVTERILHRVVDTEGAHLHVMYELSR